MNLALHKASGQAAGLHLTPHGFFLLVGLAALFLAVYGISLLLHPHSLCRRCGGSGKVSGFLGGWGYCRWCGGKGLRPRLGTVLLGWGRE